MGSAGSRRADDVVIERARVPRPRAGSGGHRIAHQPALDGLRAVAVVMVLLFHGGVSWMRGGYFGVSADGELAACHRFVGDPGGQFGDLTRGVDGARQAIWLTERHVDRQAPCTSCWARYLCGGGCHHEVLARGRGACDYIRGWLHYTIEAYGRLFGSSGGYRAASRASSANQF